MQIADLAQKIGLLTSNRDRQRRLRERSLRIWTGGKFKAVSEDADAPEGVFILSIGNPRKQWDAPMRALYGRNGTFIDYTEVSVFGADRTA